MKKKTISTIVIADSNSLIREGLKFGVCKRANDMKVIGEAADAEELMKVLARKKPDVVIMDISMTGKGGLHTLKEIRHKYPKIKVLILSLHSEQKYAARAIKAGASGYLSKGKENLSEELLKAIRMIVENRYYLTPDGADELVDYLVNADQQGKHHSLSDREYQIFCMVASGKKYQTIADELGLHVQTVHAYKRRLQKKLNLYSVAELTRYAIQEKLID